MAPRRGYGGGYGGGYDGGYGGGYNGGYDRRTDRRDDRYYDRDADRSRDYIPRSDNRTSSSNRRPRDELTPPPRRRSRSPNRGSYGRPSSPHRSYRQRDDYHDMSQGAHSNRGRRGSSISQPGSTGSSRPGSSGYDSYRPAARRGSDARQPPGSRRNSHHDWQESRRVEAARSERNQRPASSNPGKLTETSEAKESKQAPEPVPEEVSAEPLKEEVSIEERRKRREELKRKLALSQAFDLRSPLPQKDKKEAVAEEPVVVKEPSPPPPSQPSPPQEPQATADDMFASDDDMDLTTSAPAPPAEIAASASNFEPIEIDKGLAANWDDAKGYYRFSKNELLDQRYVLQDSSGLGKGMFSNVVRAKDKETGGMVAIKIIRNNDAMRKAAIKEMKILEKLADQDPQNTKHIIRLHRSFKHKGHLCMVFESLSQDLRELLKKFGRDEGFAMSAVRVYARQLFLGLSLLKECNIIHADLKPDNILASEAPHSIVKICDLGSAFDVADAEEAPELASRFYRAPEVMLGIPYDYGIDMWSIGCTIFELYTGRILFTGGTNNQMLKEIQECLGMFTERFVKQGSFAIDHFEPKPFMHFRSLETDRLTGQVRAKLFSHIVPAPERKIKAMLFAATPELAGKPAAKPTYEEKSARDKQAKEIAQLADLLEKCLQTNPEQRIKPHEALQHEFFGTPKAPVQAPLGVGPRFVPRSQSRFKVVGEVKKKA